jgi:hypothetical protein
MAHAMSTGPTILLLRPPDLLPRPGRALEYPPWMPLSDLPSLRSLRLNALSSARGYASSRPATAARERSPLSRGAPLAGPARLSLTRAPGVCQLPADHPRVRDDVRSYDAHACRMRSPGNRGARRSARSWSRLRSLAPPGLALFSAGLFFQHYRRAPEGRALAPQKAPLGSVGLHHHRQLQLLPLGG